jgi:hypothetical protein
MRAQMWTACGLTAAATIAALLVIRPPVTAQDKDKPPRLKWEYKIVTSDKAAELGEQGWELVAVTGGQPYIESSGEMSVARVAGAVDNRMTQNTVKYAAHLYHLKRQK